MNSDQQVVNQELSLSTMRVSAIPLRPGKRKVVQASPCESQGLNRPKQRWDSVGNKPAERATEPGRQEYLDVSCGREEHVLGLEVAVRHPLLMDVRQPLHGLG